MRGVSTARYLVQEQDESLDLAGGNAVRVQGEPASRDEVEDGQVVSPEQHRDLVHGQMHLRHEPWAQ